MTTSNEHNNAPSVPQGWAIKFEGNDISVSNDHMGCIVPHTETVDRKMPSEVLHALCRDLLAATPAPAPAVPQGAIVNGRIHAERLEMEGFEDSHGHRMTMCSDWHELRRCFEHLAEFAQNATPAPAPAAGILDRARWGEQVANLMSLVEAADKAVASMTVPAPEAGSESKIVIDVGPGGSAYGPAAEATEQTAPAQEVTTPYHRDIWGISHAMADLYYDDWVLLVRAYQKLDASIARMQEQATAKPCNLCQGSGVLGPSQKCICQYGEQATAPAQDAVRPQNCGTSYCSCIECVCAPAQEVGLTDEEIEHVCAGIYLSDHPQGSASYDVALARAIIAAHEAKQATPAPAPAQGEPFGYFRAEPFGWTDCAEDDEGAIALYERPQEVGLTDEGRQQVFIAAERRMVREPNISWRDAIVDEVIAALRAKGQT